MKTNRTQLMEAAHTLTNVRAQLESEFATLREQQPRVLRLAFNEAEAIAMETEFPELVFPTLAAEKAVELERWQQRQSRIRDRQPTLAFAA